jgi:excisionase family DNA binding protein
MTVKEAAERLEISLSCTYNLLTSGKLRGTRHGLGRGTWRISEEQLQQYLAAVTTGAPEAPCMPVAAPSAFTELDGGRLLAAWRARGVRAGRPGGRNAPSSGSSCDPSAG